MTIRQGSRRRGRVAKEDNNSKNSTNNSRGYGDDDDDNKDRKNHNSTFQRNGTIQFRKYELFLFVGIVSFVAIQLFHLWETTPPHDGAILSKWQTPLENLRHPQVYDSQPQPQQQEYDDWFDWNRWTSNPVTNSCIVMENICHSTHEWFYDANTTMTMKQRPLPLQPHPLELLLRWRVSPVHAERATLPYGYPDHITVQKSSSNNNNNNHCLYSPIPNHMTLHSYSNHMLGEFYTRTLIGLFKIFMASTTTIDASNNPTQAQQQQQHLKRLFQTQTQLYVHLEQGRKQFQKGAPDLLESHRLFLGLLNQNPILPFHELLDTTQCRCLKRLILCGYEVSPSSSSSKKPKTSATVLQPARVIGLEQPGDDPTNKRNKKTNDNDFDITMDSTSMNTLRRYILKHLIHDNPIMQRKIQEHRHGLIAGHANSMANEDNDDNWKVIGLAQRTGRRKWQNLSQLVSMCNIKFKSQKVVCVEVNIEDEAWSNPVQHVVAHGGLDVFMGIHGAQLTEAILMKNATSQSSLVVEFLPWIPKDVSWGQWAKWGHRPTPLGIIFSDTDLNHIGYPLKRENSIDSCKEVVEKGGDTNNNNKEKDPSLCFGWDEKNRWDNRDFTVPVKVFQDIIMNFVLAQPKDCQDFVNKAKDDYVLYNVNCVAATGKDGNGKEEKSHHHFYRDKRWVDKKQQV